MVLDGGARVAHDLFREAILAAAARRPPSRVARGGRRGHCRISPAAAMPATWPRSAARPGSPRTSSRPVRRWPPKRYGCTRPRRPGGDRAARPRGRRPTLRERAAAAPKRSGTTGRAAARHGRRVGPSRRPARRTRRVPTRRRARADRRRRDRAGPGRAGSALPRQPGRRRRPRVHGPAHRGRRGADAPSAPGASAAGSRYHSAALRACSPRWPASTDTPRTTRVPRSIRKGPRSCARGRRAGRGGRRLGRARSRARSPRTTSLGSPAARPSDCRSSRRWRRPRPRPVTTTWSPRRRSCAPPRSSSSATRPAERNSSSTPGWRMASATPAADGAR